MIVDMGFVRMRGHDEGMFTFQKAFRKFIADAIGRLRRDLSGPEGLANLIGNHIAALLSAGLPKKSSSPD